MKLRRHSKPPNPPAADGTPIQTWQEAVAILDVTAGPATADQLALAKQLGVKLSRSTPSIVAGALLRIRLAPALSIDIVQGASERYDDALEYLRRDTDPHINPASGEEAAAWVQYLRVVRRRDALANLQLKEGDTVRVRRDETATVASIGRDGRVYFKGGLGQCSWPDMLKVIARADDQSRKAANARALAANIVAHRARIDRFSKAKQSVLSEFAVTKQPTLSEVDDFERVIDGAADERPIQVFLEKHPQLLTALCRGRGLYCIAQKRLGSEHVPDFLIAGVDSKGIHWVLVELETPRSNLYLKGGRHQDKNVRQGVQQIVEWRAWLDDNLDYARRPKTQNGLGLIDIRGDAEAIVLVGRRSRVTAPTDAVRYHQAKQQIHVQTYDRLLERLRRGP